jgi:DNA polymerase-1
VDLKAIHGYAFYNYRGVAGVGHKTAANLINDYNTVEDIYKHIDEIEQKNKKLAQKLLDGYDACMIAKKLAQIVRDVPFVFDFKASEVENIELAEFKVALEKEEFHTLPRRVDEVFGSDGKFTTNGKGQMKLL